MQRKIFLEKNVQPVGKQSYVKALLFATIGLVVLAVIIPTFMRPKDPRRHSIERAFEKGAMVKREIPRSLMPTENSSFPIENSADKFPNTAASAPSSIPNEKINFDAHEEKTASAPTHQATAGSPHMTALNGVRQNTGATDWKNPLQEPVQEPSGVEMASIAGGVDKPAQETPATPDTQKSMDSSVASPLPGALPTDQKEVAAKIPAIDSKSLKKAPPAEVAPSIPAGGQIAGQEPKPSVPKKDTYAVQVGSYKDKQNAEEMRRSLQDKGYTALIKSQNHPKLGQIYVVQLQPLKDAGRANTMMAQMQNVANVKPMIVKVPVAQ